MAVTYRGRTVRYRRYRYRRSSKRSSPAVMGAGITVLALAASGGGVAAVHAHRHAVTAAAIASAPGSIAYSRAAWARAFLTAIPEPVTAANVCAVTAWETREGGGFGNQAAFNPLNVNPGPGAGWPGAPAIGAWAFPDARTGLAYSVSTITNGYYGAILSALAAGNDPQAVWSAVMASPWASSHYGGTLGGTC